MKSSFVSSKNNGFKEKAEERGQKDEVERQKSYQTKMLGIQS